MRILSQLHGVHGFIRSIRVCGSRLHSINRDYEDSQCVSKKEQTSKLVHSFCYSLIHSFIHSTHLVKHLLCARHSTRHWYIVINKRTGQVVCFKKGMFLENQDGGVGRHTAPPRTTRTDGESNSKGDQHQENRK